MAIAKFSNDGSKLHELFFMRFPEGPRSEGYQRNFNIILAAQRMAHDIERVCYHPEEFDEDDIAQAKIWQDKYAEYRATIPKGSNRYKHFYGWMYTDIYRGMRGRNGIVQQERQPSPVASLAVLGTLHDFLSCEGVYLVPAEDEDSVNYDI